MGDTHEGKVMAWAVLVLALCLLATCAGKAAEGVIHETQHCEGSGGGGDG